MSRRFSKLKNGDQQRFQVLSFFIGTYLQDHFWDCKQLESYCAEDPLRSTRWGKYWHIYPSFSTIHQTNLGKYWHIYPSLSPKQQTMLGNVKFWSKYRKLFLGLEEQAEDREVKVYEPQICWTSSLFLYLTILENHSFPFQIVKHNLKMLQTFSQPQHTFKYLVRGKTFCTALTPKSNQYYTLRAGYVNALGRAESRSETLSLDHGGIFLVEDLIRQQMCSSFWTGPVDKGKLGQDMSQYWGRGS